MGLSTVVAASVIDLANGAQRARKGCPKGAQRLAQRLAQRPNSSTLPGETETATVQS